MNKKWPVHPVSWSLKRAVRCVCAYLRTLIFDHISKQRLCPRVSFSVYYWIPAFSILCNMRSADLLACGASRSDLPVSGERKRLGPHCLRRGLSPAPVSSIFHLLYSSDFWHEIPVRPENSPGGLFRGTVEQDPYNHLTFFFCFLFYVYVNHLCVHGVDVAHFQRARIWINTHGSNNAVLLNICIWIMQKPDYALNIRETNNLRTSTLSTKLLFFIRVVVIIYVNSIFILLNCPLHASLKSAAVKIYP